MTSKKMLIIFVVVVFILVMGGLGWQFHNNNGKMPVAPIENKDKNNQLKPPTDSAAVAETKPIPGPSGDKAPASPLATQDDAEYALSDSIKSIKLSNVWNSDFLAVEKYVPRSDKADLYLKALYLWELSRLQGSTTKTKQRNESQKALTQLQANIVELDLSSGYYYSYIQWYELLMWSYEDDNATWSEGGKAANRIKELVDEVSPNWGIEEYRQHGPRYRMDGSVASVGMYVLISLYLSRDRVNYNVGERLDVSPFKKIPFNERKLVVLQDRLTSFIEKCYDGKEPDSKNAQLMYIPGTAESSTLVGGKILYFLTKAVLAEQKNDDSKNDDSKAKEYYEKAYDILHILSNNKYKSLRDTYEFVYVIRGLTQLLRLSVKRGDLGRARELVVMANDLLAKEYTVGKARHSEFYLPIAYLNYYNDSWLALRELKAGAKEVKGK